MHWRSHNITAHDHEALALWGWELNGHDTPIYFGTLLQNKPYST